MVSNFVSQVDSAFLFVFAIALAFLIGLTVAMIYFVVRFHHRKNPRGENIHGSLPLELAWTVIPTILVLAIFYYGMVGYRNMQSFPQDGLKVKVQGAMWQWRYEYENGLQTDTLFIPAGKPVLLELASSDVIHSFYVPAFRVKQDAVPGLKTKMWFTANEPGSYSVLCAEYCGDRHSYMLSTVYVMPESEFETWYAAAGAELPPVAKEKEAPVPTEVAQAEEKAPVTEGDPENGLRLIQGKGACIACHTLDGSKLIGPSFKGIFGRKTIVVVNGQEKEVIVDEDYILRSMKEPAAEVVKGFQPLMPPAPLTEQEMRDVIAYLKQLK